MRAKLSRARDLPEDQHQPMLRAIRQILAMRAERATQVLLNIDPFLLACFRPMGLREAIWEPGHGGAGGTNHRVTASPRELGAGAALLQRGGEDLV